MMLVNPELLMYGPYVTQYLRAPTSGSSSEAKDDDENRKKTNPSLHEVGEFIID